MSDEFDDDQAPTDDEMNTDEPEVESEQEYGYTEPDVQPPPPDAEQNPGATA